MSFRSCIIEEIANKRMKVAAKQSEYIDSIDNEKIKLFAEAMRG